MYDSAPPPIDGILFRYCGGDQDLVGMVEMLNESFRHDGVDQHMTVQVLSHSYHHLTNFDLETDLIIADRDHAIVAYHGLEVIAALLGGASV